MSDGAREFDSLAAVRVRRRLLLLGCWKVEEQVFEAELNKIEANEREEIMEIVTTWMQRGIRQGREEGASSLITRLLPRRVGALSGLINSQLEGLSLTQLESLAEALSDFSEMSDLENWLAAQGRG